MLFMWWNVIIIITKCMYNLDPYRVDPPCFTFICHSDSFLW